jgi:hypothetical protein
MLQFPTFIKRASNFRWLGNNVFSARKLKYKEWGTPSMKDLEMKRVRAALNGMSGRIAVKGRLGLSPPVYNK